MSERAERWLEERLEALLAMRENPRPWIETNLQIRTKDRRVVPFAFNAAQVDYYDHRTRRDIILKPRQLGFTTLICALFFADTLWPDFDRHHLEEAIVEFNRRQRRFGAVAGAR